MSFNKIKKKLGFGCMRLKTVDGQVDYDEFNRMIDAFMEAGFNYFDTAHGYIDGKSETAIRDCLATRYPREAFVLANKLSAWCFKEEKDIVPLFESQLALCGVEFFDFYLFHALNRDSYQKHKECHSFEIVKKLKEQGKIRHIGLSFHDTAEVLDSILSEQPDVEVVQLQINYLDYDDPGVQSKACYDVAVKHGKKVIVMEPVKGGALVNLPDKAAAVLDGLHGGSYASYALRYAASFPEVMMVLSGMGTMAMMEDNIGSFAVFTPLNEQEREATDRVRAIIREVRQIPCTGCNYCADVCPQGIPISVIFKEYNRYLAAKITFHEAKEAFPACVGAGDCVGCGECSKVCPQSIDIKGLLEKIANQ